MSIFMSVCSFAFTFMDGEIVDGAWQTGWTVTHRDTGGNPAGYGYWEGEVIGTPGGFAMSRSDFATIQVPPARFPSFQ